MAARVTGASGAQRFDVALDWLAFDAAYGLGSTGRDALEIAIESMLENFEESFSDQAMSCSNVDYFDKIATRFGLSERWQAWLEHQAEESPVEALQFSVSFSNEDLISALA